MKPLRFLVVGLALLFFGPAPASAQELRCRQEALSGGAFRLTCEPIAGPVATPPTPPTPPTPTTSAPPAATVTPAPAPSATPTAPVTPPSDCPTWAAVGANAPTFCATWRLLHATPVFSAASGGTIALGSVLQHYDELSSLLKLNPWTAQQVLTVHLRYLAGRDPFTTFGASHDGGATVRNALRQWPDGRCPPDPARRAACLSRYESLAPLTRGMTPAGP